MAHCSAEETSVANAEIDETAADLAHIVTEGVLALAQEDLEECEDEHGP